MTHMMKRYEKSVANNQSDCINLLQNLCDTGIDAIVVYDDVGRIRAVNRVAMSLFAYAEHELLYKQMSMLLPAIEQVTQNSESLRHIIIGVTARNMTFPAEIVVTAFSDGVSLYYFAIIRDKKGKSVHSDADLSPRQQQVLKLVVGGYTSREIANKLTISVKTVETHRANIMSKLGVPNVSSLVRYAIEQNII